MGDVLVKAGSVSEGRIASLTVTLHGLGERTLDREAALKWMSDGHSFIPVISGVRQAALQLVEDDEDARYIRADTQRLAEDALPEGLSAS